MKNMVIIVSIIGFAALFLLLIGLKISFNPFKIEVKRFWEGIFYALMFICFIGYQNKRDKRLSEENFERTSAEIIKIYSNESVKEVGMDATIKILNRVSDKLKEDLEKDNDKG